MAPLDEGVGNLEKFIGLLTDTAGKLDEGVEGLEEADDVQDVYANFDIPEALLEAVVA